MSRGKLDEFTLKPIGNQQDRKYGWWIEITLINEDGKPRNYKGVTDSPAVLMVLASALYKPNYVFTLELSNDSPPKILDVHLDDRRDYCKDGIIQDCPADTPVNAIIPTATVDDKGQFWSFYFSVGTKCAECIGRNLEVLDVIARAWRVDAKVRLEFKDGYIVGAKQEP